MQCVALTGSSSVLAVRKSRLGFGPARQSWCSSRRSRTFKSAHVGFGVVILGIEPDCEHSGCAASFDVRRLAVADHRGLAARASEPFDGDTEESRLGLADCHGLGAAGHGDGSGQGTTAGVEETRADRESIDQGSPRKTTRRRQLHVRLLAAFRNLKSRSTPTTTALASCHRSTGTGV